MLQKTKHINIAKKKTKFSMQRMLSICCKYVRLQLKYLLQGTHNVAHCIMFEFMRLTADQSDPKRHNFLEFNFFSVVHKTREFLWHFICFDPKSVLLPIMYKKRGRGQEMWHSDWVVPNTNDDVMYEYFMIIVSIVCQKKYFLNFCAEMLRPFNFGQQIKTHL